ncbi:MAG: hypothetical protein EOO92_15640 [Pedobacter sp.]|nr:MAG: hypothetical protein EOO92_15640 [Pedobacter sp.]
MKTTFTLLKATFIALLVLTSSTAMSATYYACTGSTLALTVPGITGIKYSWDVKDNLGNSIAGYPSATAPTAIATAGNYKIMLISEQITPADGICAPDAVETDVVILPALAIDLAAPTNPTYCESNSTISSSVLTPTTTGFPTTYTDLAPEYTYMVVKDNGTPIDGTTANGNAAALGTVDANGVYTLTTKIPGIYVITGRVKYKKIGTGDNVLLATCEAASSTKQVTVTATPAKPVVTIAAS